jgi:ribosomal protein S18 acetylase RimI-like enzyme
MRAALKNVEIREMELEDLAGVYALGEAVFTADKWPSLYRTWDEYEPVSLFLSDGEFCIASLLIEEVTEAYIRAGARMLIADTDADNAPAIKLFRKHHFLREDRHVYLSKNLSSHPEYLRLRNEKRFGYSGRKRDD